MNKMNLNYLELYFDDETSTVEANTEANTATEPAAGSETGSATGSVADDGSKPIYTQADLDRELAKREAELNAQFDKSKSKLKQQQKTELLEIQNRANADAEKSVSQRLAEAEQKIAEMTRKAEVSDRKNMILSHMQTANVPIDDVILNNLVGEDDETTMGNAKAYAASFEAALQARVKATLSHPAPSVGTESKPAAPTGKDFMKLSPREQVQAVRNNPSSY